MSIRPFRDIERKKTKEIFVGKVKIGGNNPIAVQSMTNTITHDIKSTIKQINQIDEEGADLVRVSCPDQESSLALKQIYDRLYELQINSLGDRQSRSAWSKALIEHFKKYEKDIFVFVAFVSLSL